MDATKALALAQDFLNSGATSDEERFSIPGTNDEVVILIVRNSKTRVKLGGNVGGWQVSPYGSGSVCPNCSGTGRI